jgi:hypothetical protein
MNSGETRFHTLKTIICLEYSELKNPKHIKKWDEARVMSKNTAKAKLFYYMNPLSEELKRKETAKNRPKKKRVCNNAEGGFQIF